MLGGRQLPSLGSPEPCGDTYNNGQRSVEAAIQERRELLQATEATPRPVQGVDDRGKLRWSGPCTCTQVEVRKEATVAGPGY